MVNNYFFTESAKSINLEALPGNFGLKKIHFTFLQFLKEKQTNPEHIFAFFLVIFHSNKTKERIFRAIRMQMKMSLSVKI